MENNKFYEEWLAAEEIDGDTKLELEGIAGDAREIEDRFYKELEFGTGGMRGIRGAGRNRMNIYNIRKVTQGLAAYLNKSVDGAAEKGVAIAYDSRIMSDEFAWEASEVLAGNGIMVYLYEDIRSTPQLSFTVKRMGCAGGLVLTASHNPPEYNGYKVYGENGGQIVPKIGEPLIAEVKKIDGFKGIRRMERAEALEKGRIRLIGSAMDEEYYESVLSLSTVNEENRAAVKGLKIVYTPLHGVGLEPVTEVLARDGFESVSVVPEQEKPDGTFPTVDKPNPEEVAALKMAIDLAEKNGADLVIATDPDSDRVGLAARNSEGILEPLLGNQVGPLLIDYILSHKKLMKGDFIVKTVVTSDMGVAVARHYGVDSYETLTGFKWICDKAMELESEGGKRFVFGYEESIGYLAGDFTKDKDAVVSAMIASEMAAFYKGKGMTLHDALRALWERHGFYKDHLIALWLDGRDGKERIGRIMKNFRNNSPRTICGDAVTEIVDFNSSTKTYMDRKETEILRFHKSNVLKFHFGEGCWFAIRPSGTEPKIKIYFSVMDRDEAIASKKIDAMVSEVKGLIEAIE
jgi:phosphoglucomutase